MLKKIILIFTFSFLMFAKVQEQDYLNIHFINVDEEYNEYWQTEKMFFENTPFENQILLIFSHLFENGNFFPPEVKVLKAEIIEETLFLDVSGDILYYYGSYMETRIKAQIIKTALDIPGINNITLLIEGEERPLLEGSMISYENECPDLGY